MSSSSLTDAIRRIFCPDQSPSCNSSRSDDIMKTSQSRIFLLTEHGTSFRESLDDSFKNRLGFGQLVDKDSAHEVPERNKPSPTAKNVMFSLRGDSTDNSTCTGVGSQERQDNSKKVRGKRICSMYSDFDEYDYDYFDLLNSKDAEECALLKHKSFDDKVADPIDILMTTNSGEDLVLSKRLMNTAGQTKPFLHNNDADDLNALEIDDEPNKRILLNVGGVRHETHVATLSHIPFSRLFKLAQCHLASGRGRQEYFFDRHPAVFNSIIDFYRSGQFH